MCYDTLNFYPASYTQVTQVGRQQQAQQLFSRCWVMRRCMQCVTCASTNLQSTAWLKGTAAVTQQETLKQLWCYACNMFFRLVMCCFAESGMAADAGSKRNWSTVNSMSGRAGRRRQKVCCSTTSAMSVHYSASVGDQAQMPCTQHSLGLTCTDLYYSSASQAIQCISM